MRGDPLALELALKIHHYPQSTWCLHYFNQLYQQPGLPENIAFRASSILSQVIDHLHIDHARFHISYLFHKLGFLSKPNLIISIKPYYTNLLRFSSNPRILLGLPYLLLVPSKVSPWRWSPWLFFNMALIPC